MAILTSGGPDLRQRQASFMTASSLGVKRDFSSNLMSDLVLESLSDMVIRIEERDGVCLMQMILFADMRT